MTVLQLTKKLKDFLEVTPPADVTSGLTIAAVAGNTLTINTSAGTTNARVGGLVKITSGALINTTVPIAANTGQVVYIGTPFSPDSHSDLVGASVSLLAGPLGAAKVFHIQPKSVKNLVEGGTSDFVFINPVTFDVEFRGVARDTNSKGARNQERTYSIQIMCAVPFATGENSPEDAYAKQTRIYDLTEQVVTRIHSFKAQVNFSLQEIEPVSVRFGLMEKESGGQGFYEVGVIDTTFGLSL
jgi:hypothetical protein